MAGYCGTETQMRLQRVAEAAAGWARTTPGAANLGRMRGCDDVETLGWEVAFEILATDQAFGFRMLPAERTEAVSRRLAERGYRVDLWNVLTAPADTALAAAGPIVAEGLAAGLTYLDADSEADGAFVGALQAFMLANGIVPFSGSMLAGEFGPVATVAIVDGGGDIAAAGHAYLPHNAHSPYRNAAWCGLVAVAPEHRGKRLGRAINAKIVEAACTRLRAALVYELVADSNLPSRRMVEASGLRINPSVKSGAAVPVGGERFTR